MSGNGGSVTLHIDAPPERLYEMVADITRMGEWSPETVSCEWIGGASGPAVGARFKARNRRGKMRWSNKPEVIVADPGREFAFRRKSGPSVVVWRYRFEPGDGGSTTVTESYEIVKPTPTPVEWLVDKMIGVTDRDADLQEGMRQTLARLKGAAEAGA